MSKQQTPPIPAKKVIGNKPFVTATSTQPAAKKTSGIVETLPFGRKNYMLLLVGIGILILGYVLLSFEQFKDATEFSIALNVAPFVILSGYGFLLYAIMATPEAGTDANPNEQVS
jgi:uncharacterized membrane protein YidH (DUF202 family)